ncbi:hypothetical protein DPMN_099149 [Dreissena polymorpha]|uniref:Uncharacterized protein n=1 Tax=Dreissena polymorpha TaxID=45954 RepID=A0A9D4R702_DREPO|nr:hypothetical protein DPMN_099149 [Dreissena polymorpha]
MRDNNTKSSSSQVCCVLLRVIHPWKGMLHHPSSFSSDGVGVDLPLTCPGEQRIMPGDVSKPSQLYLSTHIRGHGSAVIKLLLLKLVSFRSLLFSSEYETIKSNPV